MGREVGAKKGLSWRQSGKLTTRPDPTAGSNDEHMIEHKVPVEWTSSTTKDESSLALKAENETGEGDIELLNEAAEYCSKQHGRGSEAGAADGGGQGAENC